MGRKLNCSFSRVQKHRLLFVVTSSEWVRGLCAKGKREADSVGGEGKGDRTCIRKQCAIIVRKLEWRVTYGRDFSWDPLVGEWTRLCKSLRSGFAPEIVLSFHELKSDTYWYWQLKYVTLMEISTCSYSSPIFLDFFFQLFFLLILSPLFYIYVHFVFHVD